MKWERRVPLAPRHVEALCAQGFSVLVQPSVSERGMAVHDGRSFGSLAAVGCSTATA